eukprot:c899_g1_i1.p1 GENE.c899_g1_i1~~c899_g1_i1.p1  ORF type:complete len:232 (-),score=71.91 c899_g1_i1:50-745(-)
MALSESDVQAQIEQMIKFIKQEAEEKAEEIRIKSEEDFNILKQEEVEAERKRIRQDYERKEKQVDIERKIAFSNSINQNRLKVLKARDDAVHQILERARGEISEYSKSSGYSQLLQKLVVQGALSLQEDDVTIKCRKSDQKLVAGVLDAASREVQTKLGKSVKLSVDDKSFLPDGGSGPNACSGGVILSALNGAIQCDNTLDTRLNLAFEGMSPQIRITLFGRSAARKHLS